MPQCPTSPSDWPAWVQAVGSILAIAVSAGVAIWQARESREQTLFTIDQQRKADNLRMARTLIEIAKNALKLQKYVAGKLDTREKIYRAAEDNRLPFDMPQVVALEAAFDRIELHLLPSNLIAPTLIFASNFRQFRAKLDMLFDMYRKLDAAHFTDFFETMQAMQESMRLTVADLEKELAVVS